MTDTPHNLDQDDQEFFEFVVDGKRYQMRYPTTEEIEQSQKIESNEKKTEWLYGFITSLDKDAPAIAQVLKKKNVKFLQRFNQMVITEFGG